MLRAALLTTHSLSRPSTERGATTAPRLQGPKDSTGEDQVRSGVNARSWRTEGFVFVFDHTSERRTSHREQRPQLAA